MAAACSIKAGTLSLITVSGHRQRRASTRGAVCDTQFSGTTTLTDCTVSGNSAINHDGGGLSNLYSGSTTLTNCTVSGNSAGRHGGGLYSNNGVFSLTNCTVSGNTASNQGGGLTSQSSSTTYLTNTIVAGNTGGDIQAQFAGQREQPDRQRVGHDRDH